MNLRQIIYPLKIFHKNSSEGESKFNELLLKANYQPIFLGRARYGVYLAVKNSITISKKNKVLMSPYTIMDLINCVINADATVQFYDLNDDLSLFYPSLDYFEKELATNEYSCLIITHYHLNYQFIPDLKLLCEKYSVDLIEDCAISYGSKYPNTKINIGQLSDYAIFSNSLFKFSNFFWGGFLHLGKNVKIYNFLHDFKFAKKLKLHQYLSQLMKYLKFLIITNKIFANTVIYSLLRFDSLLNYKLFDRFLKNDPIVVFKKKFDRTYHTKPHNLYFLEMYKKQNLVCNALHLRKVNFYNYAKHLSKLLVHYQYLNNYEGGFVNFPILLNNPKQRIQIRKTLLKNGYDVADQQYRNCSLVDGYSEIPGETPNLSLFLQKVLFLPTHPMISSSDSLKIAKLIVKELNK
jgi:dTDP-4-amino-4,6-dideoxygalactose transaminase